MNKITFPLKEEMRSEAVASLQDALRLLIVHGVIQLGLAERPAIEESLRNERTDTMYSEVTRYLVKLFQEQRHIESSGAVDEPTAKAINEAIEELGPSVVHGQVRQEDGSLAAGVVVRAFDKDLRHEEQLGEVRTDEAGQYEIQYTADQFRNAEKGSADLRVCVLDTNGEELVSSEVEFNAPAEMAVNFTLAPQLSKGSEFERLLEAILPLLKAQGENGEDLPIAKLDRNDVEFLVKDTGLPPERIRMLIAATTASSDTGVLADSGHEGAHTIPVEAFYGWFRMGLPQDPDVLLARPAAELAATLRQAVQRGIIPARIEAELGSLGDILNGLRLERELRPAPSGMPATLGDLLNTAGRDWLDEGRRRAVAEARLKYTPESTEFEEHLRAADLSPADIGNVRAVIALGDITRGHAPMVKALADKLRANGDDHSLGGLAKLAPDEWLDLAYDKGPPPGRAHSPSAYAVEMAAALEQAAPMAVLETELKAGRFKFEQPGFASVGAFLAKNRSFDFATTSIDDFMEKADLTGIKKEDHKSVAGALRQLQQTKQVGARWSEAQVLIGAGLGSIEEIADFGKERLKQQFGDQIPEERLAQLAENALAIRAMGIGLVGTFMPLLKPSSAFGGDPRTRTKKTQALLDESPTLRKLFGALESCECESCASVLSPAAYFVDLLRFVEKDFFAWLTLARRRPDLLDLELSCDNANIPLPYIDLANEVLENAVALPYRIELGTGTDVRTELAKSPITGAIRVALQKTAIEPLGDLAAVPDKWSIRHRINRPGVSYWVVTDRYRRWVLEATDAYFGPSAGIGDGMSLQGVDVQELTRAMDQGNVLAAVKDRFYELLRKQVLGDLPVSITKVMIEPAVEAGKRWKVKFDVAGAIDIDDRTSTVLLSSLGNEPPRTTRYSQKGITATKAALEKDRLGGLLEPMRGGTRTPYKIEKRRQGWIHKRSLEVEIVCRSAGLAIAGLTYQSTAADRDLKVRPQHRNPIAYEDHLKKAVFPWDGPFDLNLVETRALLARSRWSRLGLIEAATPRHQHYANAVLARERLGLSADEAAIITTPRQDDALWKCWGLAVTGGTATIYDSFAGETVTGTPPEVLRRVSILMQQGGLKFTELEALLESEEVNPGRKVRIIPTEDCDPTKLKLDDQYLTQGHLDRLHRFVRLQRRLGWEVRELDIALRRLAIAGREQDTLQSVANIQNVHKRLGVSVELVATWLGGFDRSVYSTARRTIDPLYERTFQDRRLMNPPDGQLSFGKLSGSSLSIEDRAALIASAFGIVQGQLLSLLRLADPALKDLASAPLNEANLLSLLRHSTLARALGLPIDGYVAAWKLIGPSPFSTSAALSTFCDELDWLKNSGFEAKLLAYALNYPASGDGIDEPAWVLTPERAKSLLLTLQTALREGDQAVDDAVAREVPWVFSKEQKDRLQTAPGTNAERWQRWRLQVDATGIATWADPEDATVKFSGAPLGVLGRAQVLAAQADLSSLDELRDVLQAAFIDPTPPTLEIKNVAVAGGGNVLMVANLTTAHLDRLERFLILQRVSSLHPYQLDMAIRAFTPPGSGADPLSIDLDAVDKKLQSLLRLRERVGLSLDVLVSWWGGLGGRAYVTHKGSQVKPIPAVFEELFPAGQTPTDFQLSNDRTRLQVEASPPTNKPTLADHQALLARTFRVDEKAVADVRELAALPDDNLTLDNLSRMHRVLTLSEALGIPVRTVFRIRDAASVKPFEAPSEALRFIETAKAWYRRINVVENRIAETFGFDPMIAADLLWNHLTGAPNSPRRGIELFVDPAARFDTEGAVITLDGIEKTSTYAVVLKLHRISLLNSVWNLARLELAWFPATSGPAMEGLKFDDLASPASNTRFTSLRKSAALLSLVRRNAAMQRVIAAYVAAVPNAPVGGGLVGTRRGRLARAARVLSNAFDVPQSDVERAAGQKLLAIQESECLDPWRLADWIELVITLKKLNASAADLELLIASSPTPAAVAAAQRVLRSSFGEDGWRAALHAAADELRVQQRDHLAAYLVWRDGLRDADALYESYLIDVKMSACMTTTRLLQSVAAVQLFVQRCLMNLEDGVSPKDIDPEGRWEWMKNYRVWEANRKVFLYPEYLLFPELRDDKSETFRAFESVLTQNEANRENSERAVREYLDGLLEISQISVLGMYEHAENVAAEGDDPKYRRTLYLVGRSPNPPYVFYWRQALRFGEPGMRWTGWERIDLDLSGDHVVPFMFEGDFHVAWPLIDQVRQDEKDFYDLRLAWARRTSVGWTKRKVSRQPPLRVEKLLNRDERSMFAFVLNSSSRVQDAILIDMFVAEVADVPGRVDLFSENKLTRGDTYKSVGKDDWKLYISSSAYVRYADSLRVAKVPLMFYIEGLEWEHEYNNAQNRPAACYYPTSTGSAGPFRFETEELPIRGDINIKLIAVYEGLPSVSIPASFLADPGRGVVCWVQFVFAAAKDPEKAYTDRDAPLNMFHRGQFQLRSDSDGEWSGKLSVSYPLPQVNVLCWCSGFKETHPLDSGLGGVCEKSDPVERFFAVCVGRDQESARMAKDSLWYVEEGEARFLFQHAPSGLRAAYPGAFGDAGRYKTTFARAAKELYIIEQQRGPLNTEFGGSALIKYILNRLSGGRDPRDVSLAAFDLSFPYAAYNWEVFFHIPMAAARFLGAQQRFDDAEQWLRCVFDPMTNDPTPGPERFWRFLPFRHANRPETISELLTILAKPDADITAKRKCREQVEAWLADPFNPFAVARLRPSAFEWYTVVAWVKNAVAWGDRLFRRDTRESINEATLLYVLAAKILGPRPQSIPPRGLQRTSLSYRALAAHWDEFSNAWYTLVDTRAGRMLLAPVETETLAKRVDTNAQAFESLTSVASLYFCIPRNDKLDELWDTVEDRLFKIRNCRNIEGVLRDLPLLEPPIDPELLIRAKAAGIDIADVLADRFAPPPLYRFSIVLQKALEFCAEVKALGAATLAAIEKKDAEKLALLRSSQEIEMLGLVQRIKEDQVKESEAAIQALRQSRASIVERFRYLQRLLGRNDIRFDTSGAPIVEQTLTLQVQETGMPDDFRNLALIRPEIDQISRMQEAHVLSFIAGALKTVSSGFHVAAGLSVTKDPTDKVYKLLQAIAAGASALGDGAGMLATNASNWEKRAGLIAGFERRREDWIQQAKAAVDEIRQIDRQIAGAGLRKAIAEKDLSNHTRTIEHAKNIDDYMRHEKFTTSELYTWMEGQLAGVHITAYQLAVDLAKRAERAFRFELGQPNTSFVAYGNWDSLKKGLLAGDRLANDLRRMEAAYLEQNRREYEITKHISLWSLDAAAVLSLRQKGWCEIAVPEAMFDLDCPGHYFRRIKSVGLTVPCVTGPYTSVNCLLTLLGSSVRHRPEVNGVYGRDLATDDPRFTDIFGAVQSIVTSSAQSDSGLFEPNLRDERFLPFEGCGAISRWRIELPDELRQFDYSTITDVILHLRYTAREGGSSLRGKAVSELKGAINSIVRDAGEEGLARAFSLRHEFPTEWHRFQNPSGSGNTNKITLALGKERFPFLLQAKPFTVEAFDLFVVPNPAAAGTAAVDEKNLMITFEAGTAGSADANKVLSLVSWRELLLRGRRETPAGQPGSWTLTAWRADSGAARIHPNAISDVIVLCRLSVT